MTRVLRGSVFDDAPVDVPAPPAWDAVAVAAYEQGFAQGVAVGRRDVSAMSAQLDAAVARCLAAVDAATEAMARRAVDVAELFVVTALRHVPEARTAGLLVRLGEVLRAFEPGPLELSVHPELAAEVTAQMAARNSRAFTVSVIGDGSLMPGEFRLHSEWADADGTFERYLAAARDAMELHLSGAQP